MATLLTGVVGSNNALTFTANLAGEAGNGITINLRAPTGNNLPLAISVVGKAITVDLATGAGGTVSISARQRRSAASSGSCAHLATASG